MKKRLGIAAAAVVLAAVGWATTFAVAPNATADTFYRTALELYIPPPHDIQGYADKCIDVPDDTSADGVQLQLWDCDRSPGQWFTSGPQGQAMVLGKCMDVARGSRENGAKVQLAWCNNGPAQIWIITRNGRLVNPQSNKCVDVREWNPNNGALLQIWDCHDGANQNWHLRG